MRIKTTRKEKGLPFSFCLRYNTYMNRQEHAGKIIKRLKITYPNAKIILNFSNTWELLVAVILSAQCTDIQVNKVTEKLFKKYKTIKDYANAPQEVFEQDIRSTGFYRNKAKNIINTAKIIIEKHNGEVPHAMNELLTLPGVARKTANIVLSNAYNINEGIAVDTHVMRLSQRLGLTNNKNPEKIEQDLIKLYPKDEWNKVTYLLIEHGRAICQAKKPKCDKCILSNICPSAFHFPQFEN